MRINQNKNVIQFFHNEDKLKYQGTTISEGMKVAIIGEEKRKINYLGLERLSVQRKGKMK